VSRTNTLISFALHEARLAWRDWLFMITAGGRWGSRTVVISILVFAAAMHLLAWGMVGTYANTDNDLDKATLLVITASMVLSWSLMISQAMESVTRAFYARSDFDLILSSPACARDIFAARTAAIALSTVAMALLLAAPFINVLAAAGGPRWFSAYGVVFAMGASATAIALAATLALLHSVGPKRTRLIAQIIAAVIGAAFVVSLQIAAIFSSDLPSRLAFVRSEAAIALTPDIGSFVWWPARAILGNIAALAAVLGMGLFMLLAALLMFSKRLGAHRLAATSVVSGMHSKNPSKSIFVETSPKGILRRKEWLLLGRDPWLVSQTLMQMLYLLPPAVLLWRSYHAGDGAFALLVPVLVMAAGQLAGGLAWLAISGEDAPELVATAPLPVVEVTVAKVEAVMGAIVLVFAPFVLALAFASPFHAAVAAAGIAAAAGSATMVQLWFRAQAKRSHFRRRQTSSRIATLAEAFSSISWAATAALVAAGNSVALLTAISAGLILLAARCMRPK
jgi:ABC-2 type transport system permease protein